MALFGVSSMKPDLALVPVVCTDCGCTLLFSADVMKLSVPKT
jgi:hypothetical protein